MIGGVQSARKRTEKYENYRCTKMYSALVGMGDCSSPFHSARETRYGCEVLNTTCSTREGLRFRNSEESFFPTCQVRVSIDFIRVAFSFLPSSLPPFLASSLPPSFPPPLLLLLAGTAGLQLRAPDLSGHCRASTASSISVGRAYVKESKRMSE